MKQCPYCKSEIDDEALKCRYCGEWVEKRLKTNFNKVKSIISDKKQEIENKKKIKEQKKWNEFIETVKLPNRNKSISIGYGLFSKEIKLCEDHFSHGKNEYKYDDINAIHMKWIKESINFIPSSEYIKITLELEGRIELSKTENALDYGYGAYIYFCEKSFNSRYEKHINQQIREKGFVTIDKYSFKKEVIEKQGIINNINELRFSISRDFIYIKHLDGREWFKVDFNGNRDVFLAFLKNFYGITFQE